MYDKIQFGQRITNLRKSRWGQYKNNQYTRPNPFEKFSCCKTQESLAETLNVERRAVGKWETGTSSPSLENLVNLCDKLECNIDYLLGAEALSEVSPIVIASHYSGIEPEIIRYGVDHSEYLDCLNHFMHPDNCSSLFNSITLTAWKEYLSDKNLDEIKDPLKSCIIDIFQQYQAFTPLNNYSKETYRQHIASAISKNSLTFSSKKLDERINIKSCIDIERFNSLGLSNKNNESYENFINYIVDYTFDVFTNKTLLDLQKDNLGKSFVRVFEKYLSD